MLKFEASFPAITWMLANWAEPNCVEFTRRAVPLTCADRPVVALTPLMAVAIELTVVPEANDNCVPPVTRNLQGNGRTADIAAC